MTWWGPRDDDWEDDSQLTLKEGVPPERWPHGPPEDHQDGCSLHNGGLYCDCSLSSSEDE